MRLRLLIVVIAVLALFMQTMMVSGEEGWRDIIDQYGWDGDKAEAVIDCESGGSATAINGVYVGLFQVDTVLHRWSEEELLIPEVNIAAAYELYSRRGWQPWRECGLIGIGMLPETGYGPDSY